MAGLHRRAGRARRKVARGAHRVSGVKHPRQDKRVHKRARKQAERRGRTRRTAERRFFARGSGLLVVFRGSGSDKKNTTSKL